MTTVREILEKEVKLPKCPFQAKRLISDLDRASEIIEKHINDRTTTDSNLIRTRTSQLREKD